jgi:SAM-dependent methyltransferase
MIEVYRNQIAAVGAARPDAPKILNLGSGKDWREDCFNVDILPRVYPDLCLDICAPIPWGLEVNTSRFKSFQLQPGLFEKIIANDVLEHLPDLTTAMRVCLDLLGEGGEFHIKVPYDLSYGAWQDPTHVRAFNERSWLYYCDWHWYLGWNDFRFVTQKLEFDLSEYGNRMKNEALPDDFILRTPRAVDDMRVVLKKMRIA